MVQKRVFVFITRFARAARLVTVVTLVTLDRVAAKQRSGIALVLSSTIDINHQRRETPPLRRFAASRAHVSIADRAYMYPFFVRVTLVRIECMVARGMFWLIVNITIVITYRCKLARYSYILCRMSVF